MLEKDAGDVGGTGPKGQVNLGVNLPGISTNAA